MSQATTNITAPARMKASNAETMELSMPIQPGIHSAKRAIASAANNTMAPCEKLNTPEAL